MDAENGYGTLIVGLDAEIAAARAEMIRRIDEEVIPAMIARRQHNLATATREEIDGMFARGPRSLGLVPGRPAATPDLVAACRGDILRLLGEAGRNGISIGQLWGRVRGLGHAQAPYNSARRGLECEGVIVLQRSRWRMAEPDDALPVPPALSMLVASRRWDSLADLVIACLEASAPQAVRTKGLKLMAGSIGYAEATVNVVLVNLHKEGRIENPENGQWRLAGASG